MPPCMPASGARHPEPGIYVPRRTLKHHCDNQVSQVTPSHSYHSRSPTHSLTQSVSQSVSGLLASEEDWARHGS